MSKTYRNKSLNVFKYLSFFLLFIILGLANINGVVYPFAFGALFALVWCNQKPLILAPLFIAAGIIINPSQTGIINVFVTAFVCLVSYGVHYKTGKRLSPLILGIYALVSQSVFLFLEIQGGASIILSGVTVIGGTLFMFAMIKFFEAVLVKGLYHKLSLNEIICAGVLIAAVASGLSAIEFFDVSLIKFTAIILIMISSIVLGSNETFFISSALGIGVLLQSGNSVPLALFSVWALVCSFMKTNRRLVLSAGIASTEILFVFISNGYDQNLLIYFAPTLAALILVCIIPKNLLLLLQGTFACAADKMAIRNIVNRSREVLYRRLSKLSEIFKEMDNVFKQLIKGNLSDDQINEMLISEIKLKVCYDCQEKNKCHRTLSKETTASMNILCQAAFERGKATLLDVPSYISARCGRINQILAVLNQLALQYKQYASLMNNIDSSRLMIAQQLGGVGGIMQNLATEVKSNVSFDASKEINLINELSTEGIECHDIAVFEESDHSLSVTIVLKNEFANNSKIEPVVSKILNVNMKINSLIPSKIGGFTILTLGLAPKYELLLGAACSTKTGNQISGDSYSLTKLTKNKFLLALCDGMGSGAKAEKASNLAISLIENFYLAGFENDIILSNINKLLVLGNEEVFSALDLCVFDLQEGIADIIKLGSPCSFFKSDDGIETIECSSLPLGILNDIEPTTKKLVLKGGDIFVVCSDGISDSFHSSEEFSDFVNNIDTKNVQDIANRILDQAISFCGGVSLDDMTVLVCKIVKSY